VVATPPAWGLLPPVLQLPQAPLSPSLSRLSPAPVAPKGANIYLKNETCFCCCSGLNTEQMILKDMKVVSETFNVAISVLYITLELSSCCQKFGFDLLILMTISFTESREPIRELAVFSQSSRCREQVCQYLEQSCSPALDLRPISTPLPHISAYHQGNRLASRKKLLPLVKAFLKEQSGDRCPGPGEEEESDVPPTPMNSLVEGCPLNEGLPQISAQALQEKFSKLEGCLCSSERARGGGGG
uniref:DHHA2 domain-containing protein n=1 Tax=Oryzias sinensis TaxID=183150 RepID=A0A8C7WV25_9TELE